jgi:hypothetical protein
LLEHPALVVTVSHTDRRKQKNGGHTGKAAKLTRHR